MGRRRASSPGLPSVRGKVGILFALWFVLLISYLDRVAITFAGPAIMTSLAISPAQFGLILSSFGVGHLLAQVPGGFLADRHGAKRMLVLAPVTWAVLTGATGLIASMFGMIGLRFGLGLCEALSTTALYKMVGDHFNSRSRAPALSIVTSAISLAPAFAGPIIGLLIGGFGWKVMFLLLIAPSLLGALFCQLLLPSNTPLNVAASEDSGEDADSFWIVAKRPSLWLATLAYLLYGIGFWGYISWMPTYLATTHHIDLRSTGLLSGIPYVCAFAGTITGGWLGSTIFHAHRPQLVGCTYLLAALAMFFAYQAVTLNAALLALSAASFFLFSAPPSVGAVILDLSPSRYRAAYFAFYNTGAQVGGILAPAVIGFTVSASGSFATGFAFMIAALCVAAVCIFNLSRFLKKGVVG